MNPLRAALLILLFVPTTWADKLPAEAKKLLDKATTLELYSLEPNYKGKPKEAFNGWKMLGKVKITKKAEREAVLAAIEEGAEGGGRIAKCFEPRHGLRATVDSKIVDLTICFHCGFMEVYVGEKRTTVKTDRSPVPILNKILKDAGVKLAKTSE